MKFGILGLYWTIVIIIQVSTLKENMLSAIVEDFFFSQNFGETVTMSMLFPPFRPLK